MESTTNNRNIGKVYLVGAGPGDPRLVTLRAVECLQQADLVLYDGLVNPLILRHTNGVIERTARARRDKTNVVPQEDVIARLVDEAKSGKTVVRLKGGDPFIFGRGGEEATALAEHRIPYEVVPGITAATAASEYAGIPLTDRRFASQVLFLTGHEDPAKTEAKIDYEQLARFEGTIVIYMGLPRLADVTSRLIAAGMDATKSAAIVSKATLPQQQAVYATLENIVDKAGHANIEPPSLVIIGQCVEMHSALNWFERLPLFGLNIGITRPSHQAEPQIQNAIELGARPVLIPMIEIEQRSNEEKIQATLNQLENYRWIVFTSRNGVDGFISHLENSGKDLRALANCRIASIGSSTAEVLQSYHLKPDLIPDDYRSESLAETLIERIRNEPLGIQRVLWPRANRGRDVLPDQLREAGIELDELVVYEHIDATEFSMETNQLIDNGELHWVGLSSPAIARIFASLLTEAQKEKIGQEIKLASISPVTTAAAEEVGLRISAEAPVYTWDGIFEAIIKAERKDRLEPS